MSDTPDNLVPLEGGAKQPARPAPNPELVQHLTELLRLATSGGVQHAAIVVAGAAGVATVVSVAADSAMGLHMLHSATGVLYADLTDDIRTDPG